MLVRRTIDKPNEKLRLLQYYLASKNLDINLTPLEEVGEILFYKFAFIGIKKCSQILHINIITLKNWCKIYKIDIIDKRKIMEILEYRELLILSENNYINLNVLYRFLNFQIRRNRVVKK
jgi:hypothetical protein